MRGLALAILAGAIALVIWVVGFGGNDLISRWATDTQRDVQNAMAQSIRALRAGEGGAMVTLWTLCFTYGFVHAAGPGHGKLIIGGYGLGARVPAKRLVGLAIASSLAQAVTAILLVTVALWLLGWGREQMTTVADQVMAPLSYGLIAAIGLWLMIRGLRSAWRMRRPAHTHDHAHEGDGVCSTCGHAHGPTIEQAAEVRSVKDAIAVITSIAIRPCTGALFLLILTHALGILWAGIVGTLIMGLGTAAFTGLIALMAGFRESSLMQAATGTGAARLMVAVEVLVGGVVLVLALQLMLRSLVL